MAGKVVKSNFELLSKFGASRQESASKTATSHIREPLQARRKTDKSFVDKKAKQKNINHTIKP